MTAAAPLRFVFCGVGGQGSLFGSLMLGDAAVAAGLEVVMSEIHGMSQRGGSVVSTVIVGAAHGPLVADGEADVLVAFEPVEALRAARFCSARTTAVVALRPWVPPSVAFGAAKYPPVADVLGAMRKLCGRVFEVDAVLRRAAGAERRRPRRARRIGSPAFRRSLLPGCLPPPPPRGRPGSDRARVRGRQGRALVRIGARPHPIVGCGSGWPSTFRRRRLVRPSSPTRTVRHKHEPRSDARIGRWVVRSPGMCCTASW
jgi:indolepyruvate ferredoxin oxidoreductase beta subunit